MTTLSGWDDRHALPTPLTAVLDHDLNDPGTFPMSWTRSLALALLLIASMAAPNLHADQASQDRDRGARQAYDGEALFSDPSYIRELWVTTPGVIFILESMPEGVTYFSADENPGLKLDLLLKAVEHRWKVRAVYDSTGGSTREAVEIRLEFPQASK